MEAVKDTQTSRTGIGREGMTSRTGIDVVSNPDPRFIIIITRENEGTEREAQGIGRDMSCPGKLFLDGRKSLF